jgi:signal transduction histidine kinase
MELNPDDDGSFVLTIKDDGRTFAPNGTRHNGRGIGNIRARAGLIGGKASWKTRRGRGNVFRLAIDPAHQRAWARSRVEK